MNRIILLFATIATIFSACSTEFDVTAPYKEIPVIFGILNKDEAVQYIKINKAFLNDEGSAIIAGSVPDSNIYTYPIEVKLYASYTPITDSNIQYISSVELDTVHLNKEAGSFNANNIFYKTPDNFKLRYNSSRPGDTTWANYQIIVRRKSDGKLIAKSRTPIVADFLFSGTQNEVKLYNRFAKPAPTYTNHTFSWGGAINGKMYTAFLRFKFREVDDLVGTSEDKYVDMPLFENIKTSNSNGSSKISYTLSGESFFTYLQAKLDPLTSSSARREYIAPLELYFNVAGGELTKYIEINNGSGGLNDIRPEYSNVEGGLGIFSSRMNKVFNQLNKTNLNQDAIYALKEGDITGRGAGTANDLGFR
jgi:hypothetical protein